MARSPLQRGPELVNWAIGSIYGRPASSDRLHQVRREAGSARKGAVQLWSNYQGSGSRGTGDRGRVPPFGTAPALVLAGTAWLHTLQASRLVRYSVIAAVFRWGNGRGDRLAHRAMRVASRLWQPVSTRRGPPACWHSGGKVMSAAGGAMVAAAGGAGRGDNPPPPPLPPPALHVLQPGL